MDTPSAIESFFRIKNQHVTEGMSVLFTEDAVVRDHGENDEVKGVDAVVKWVEGTIAKYKLANKILSARQEEGKWIVDVEVSGDFKGSPAKFRYDFILDPEGKIASMDIVYIG